MREQERRKRQAISRADGIKNRIAGRMHKAELLAKESKRRADQVKRRIEVGDVEPRPLPSLREDSLPSMESMESSESMASMESMESPALTGGVPSEEEAYGGGNMSEDMPLAIDPKGAHEELGQRITEDTGAGTDMKEHADRKVEQMGNELLGG